MSEFETIDYTVEDGVAIIRLDRPMHLNAINRAMHLELPRVWQRFKTDRAAIVAVLTGAGDKAFCTGADISDLPDPDWDADPAAAIRWSPRQNAVGKPVICAVNGMTVGGGLHFVADSDIVIAAEHATFFDTHVRVGLIAGLEPVALCRRMPLEAVLRMTLVGGRERMSAQRARELGMISEYVPAEQLMGRALQLANWIKCNSPLAMARSKEAIWQAQEMHLSAGLAHAWQLIAKHSTAPDCIEGTQAFIEKRPPRWQPFHEE